MITFVRVLLYCFGALLLICGITGILNPDFLAGKLTLMPMTTAGTSEIRSLNGGGMTGFGIVILLGLRNKSFGRGLLLSIAIIMSCVVVGRLVSLAVDHEIVFTLTAGFGELLIAAACCIAIRHDNSLAS